MPETIVTSPESRQIWINAYNLAFSRHMGEEWPAEKCADAAKDEANAAVVGAAEFLGSM